MESMTACQFGISTQYSSAATNNNSKKVRPSSPIQSNTMMRHVTVAIWNHLEAQEEEEEDEEEQHLFCVVNEFNIGKGETSVERPEPSVKSHYIPLSLPLSLSLSLCFGISSLLRLRAARPRRCSTMPRQRPRNQHPWRRSKSCRTLQWNSQKQNSTNTTSGDPSDSSNSSDNAMSKANLRRT